MRTRGYVIGLSLIIILLAVMGFFRFSPTLFPSFSLERISGEMLFTGDVMLSRYVEKYARERGEETLFAGVTPLFERYAHVIGNLEGTVPETHAPIGAGEMRFSIDTALLPLLPAAGFTHMTLANNHAFDYGAPAYRHTQTALTAVGVETAGHPGRVAADDVLTVTLDEVEVAIVPVHMLGGVQIADVVGVLAELESDMQIVVVHWGEEYALTASTAQRNAAHAFIDAGASAVIGHHPHVVQNIEVYESAPIFYSLGNFVFDQYWNTDVERGLTVGLAVDAEEVTYTLIPVVSDLSRVRAMDAREREAFLEEIAERSDRELGREIRIGELTFGTRN